MQNVSVLPYDEFTFRIRFLEDAALPVHKGSMFRGAFGWAFKGAVCLTRLPECAGCIIRYDCSYFRVFETEVPQHDVWYLQGVKKVLHPFIILPPADGQARYEKGSELEVRLKLFGSAAGHIAYFILSFLKMGETGLSVRRHRFELLSVHAGEGENRKEVYANGMYYRHEPGSHTLSLDNQYSAAEERFTLRLLTPTVFQQYGKVVQHGAGLTAEILMNTLLRRFYGLTKLFGKAEADMYQQPPAWGDTVFLENNLYYEDLQRYSNRQQQKMEFGGLMGTLNLSTKDPLAKALLQAGTVTHVGKYTAFGYGNYELRILNSEF